MEQAKKYMDVLIKRGVDMLKQEDVKETLREQYRMIIRTIFVEFQTYIYVVIGLVFFIFVMLIVILFILVMRVMPSFTIYPISTATANTAL